MFGLGQTPHASFPPAHSRSVMTDAPGSLGEGGTFTPVDLLQTLDCDELLSRSRRWRGHRKILGFQHLSLKRRMASWSLMTSYAFLFPPRLLNKRETGFTMHLSSQRKRRDWNYGASQTQSRGAPIVRRQSLLLGKP